MKTINVLLKYKLYELRNCLFKELRQTLYSLPRLAADVTAFCFLYRWLLENSGYAPLILTACLLLTLVLGLITGFSSLFANRQNSFLLTAPVAFPAFLTVRYLERLVLYLEFALVLGLPAALVLGGQYGLLPAILLLCLSVLAVSIMSYLLAVVTAYFCGSKSQIALVLFPLAVLVLPGIMMEYLKKSVISGQFLAGANLIALASLMLLILWILAGGSPLGRIYYIALAKMQDGRRRGSQLAGRLGYRLLGAFKGPVWALTAKDLLFHARNAVQWVRALLLLISVALYSLLRPRLLPPGLLQTPVLDVAVVLGLTHFIINEVTLNAFSAEANRIKLLVAAPVNAFQIVFGKYLSFGLPVLLIGLLCMIFLGVMSGFGIRDLSISILTGGVILFGVTAALVGVGAINSIPDREADGFMEQFMIEQTAISSPRALLVFGLGTILLIVDLASVYWIYSCISDSQGRTILVLIVLLANLLLGIAAIIFGADWMKRHL